MRPIWILLIASVVTFAAWYFLRPDPRSGEEAGQQMVEQAAGQAEEQAAQPVAMDEEPIPEVERFSTREDEIVAIYENAPWTSAGNDGPVLYVISFRSCPTCLAFKHAEMEGLMDAGVDVRWLIYARRNREGRERSSPAERAVQAELWLTRDWHLFEQWYEVDPMVYYETADLPPMTEGDPAREAAVEEARALVDTLADLYAENEIDLFIPALLYQDGGEWRTYVGYEEESFEPVREALTGQR